MASRKSGRTTAGRHTTTHRQLIMLPSGVMVIDTPGLRMLGMWDVTEGLGEAFGDVEEFLGRCKFSDCRHQSEPGCAVKEAIADGRLPLKRWESYLKLKMEARFSDDKATAMQERRKRNKEISRFTAAKVRTVTRTVRKTYLKGARLNTRRAPATPPDHYTKYLSGMRTSNRATGGNPTLLTPYPSTPASFPFRWDLI